MPIDLNGNTITSQSIGRYGESLRNLVMDGLVLHLDAANKNSYPGSGTTWTDLSGKSNNATLVNGPTFDSGKGGNIVFDGSNDYASVANTTLLSTLTGISVETWIKFDALSARQIIAEKHTSPSEGWWLAGQSNKLIWILVTNTSEKYIDMTNNTTLSTGTIYHIVGTYNGSDGTLKVYVNGSDDGGTVAGSGTGFVNSSNTMYIGARLNWGPGYSDENIYTFSVYNRALSAQEVLQNYNATKSRFV